MVKDIQTIDFSNEMDILYAYKNIKEFPALLDQFHKIKFCDLSFSLFCYGIVEKAVLEELGETFVDHEMEEVVRMMLSNPSGEPSGTCDAGKGFYISHLNVLLRPLVNICNKQIVDLVYYVFKKSGVNHFDFLFDVFTSESQLIELHLLVAKGMRDRSFDLSDIKECLEHEGDSSELLDDAASDSDLVPPTAPDSAPPSSSDNAGVVSLGGLSPSPSPIIPLPFSDKSKDLHIDVGYFPSDNSSEEELDHVRNLAAKPFKERSIMNPAFHLQRAKELLLNYKDNDATFFIENVATYLSMKFDRELFAEYLSYKCYNPFSSNLKKLHAPFFFYADASITKILAPVTKVVRKDPYDFTMYESSCSIPINSYILKYFLEFCHATFFDINSPLGDYILISKSLRYFVEFYRDPAFFKVFYELLNCKISKIEADIKSNLLSDLCLYVDVFYGHTRTALDDSDEELDNWTLKLHPSHKKISQNLYDDGSKTNNHKKPSVIPSIGEDSKSALTNAYINASFYDDIEKKISHYLLDLFSKNYNEDQVDVDEFLESFVLEISSDPSLKVYVLRNIEKIHSKLCKAPVHEQGNDASSAECSEREKCMHSPCFNKVLENLKDFPKVNWRYKKVFVNKLDELEKLGVDRRWVKETLESDRVFYIKNMVNSLK